MEDGVDVHCWSTETPYQVPYYCYDDEWNWGNGSGSGSGGSSGNGNGNGSGSGSDGGSSSGDGNNDDNNDTQTTQEKLCNAYHGVLNIASLRQSSNSFSSHQEIFIISLANLAAFNALGYSLVSLKTDLNTYTYNSSLYTKYNKLNNIDTYISTWTAAYNSSPNSDTAYVSPEIGNSGFQLKYYPEKNGEYNAIGLVKEGFVEHSVEAALELLESYLGLPDDLLYDMHLFNALNFMEYYCND
jgi:hypothetical protein